MPATTAKAALAAALPGIKQSSKKAHVASLVASDHFDTHGSYPLEVDQDLAGEELADAVFSAYPSLGYCGKD